MLIRFTVVAAIVFALLAACQPKPQEQVPPTPNPALQVAPSATPDAVDVPPDFTEETADSLAPADEPVVDEPVADEPVVTE